VIAVISDIHGNLEALDAVLEDAKSANVRELICLGDIVGYGADPNGCMERVSAAAKACVLGNHDAAARDLSQAENFNEIAREAIRWTQEQLTAENLERLNVLPFEFIQGEARYVHASPDNPSAWHYILTEQEAWNAFEACPEPLCFVGHSHVPLRVVLAGGRLEVLEAATLELRDGARALVNVGSVGQPRDGDWRAAYALFDPEGRRVTARRVEYDLRKASSKILQAGLPEILARRLSQGQ
jgi:diadenosine tetraphosphatase ApaH/serine/threonine PP2A family protein phosphatase